MKYNTNEELKKNVIKFRRDLHTIPELDFDLPKTAGYLKDHLGKLSCSITDIGKASFVAFFDAGHEDTVAFRTDMDALPIEEETGHDFCSVHKGKMHACGHDGHMSIMLGFASEVSELIERNDKELRHNVLMVFQAGEETTGGAKEICDSGIFEKYNTKKIYGLHIWPDYPRNTVICRKGPFMAGTKVLWLTVEGRSSHIAKPDEGIDALDIGTRLVQSIYKMEKEELPPAESRILKFGEFHSGTGVNILSARTEIGGTTRFFDDKILNVILRRIEEISHMMESRYGCTIKLETSEGYPPVINSDEMVDELEEVINELKSVCKPNDYPEGCEELTFFAVDEPMLTSEDFAYYQQRLPGLFFHLGTGLDLSLHNGNYDIEEEILLPGIGLFKALLLNN